MVEIRFKKILEKAYVPGKFDGIEIPENGELPDISNAIKDCYPDDISTHLALGKYTRQKIAGTHRFCDIDQDHFPEASLWVHLKRSRIYLRWINERNGWIALMEGSNDKPYEGPFALDEFCASALLFTYLQSDRLTHQDVVKTHPKDLTEMAAKTMPKFPKEAVIFKGEKTRLEYVIKFKQDPPGVVQHNYFISAHIRGTVDETTSKAGIHDKDPIGLCWGIYTFGKVTHYVKEPRTEVFRLDVEPPHDEQGLGSKIIQLLYDILPKPTNLHGIPQAHTHDTVY